MVATFVRKTKILSDGYLDAGYPDLSDGQTTSLYVGGGLRKRIAYANFQLAERLPFGNSTLSGAVLRYFVDSTKVYNNEDTTETVPSGTDDGGLNMFAFNVKNNLLNTFSEGDTVVSNTDLLAYSSHMTEVNPILFDTFEGSSFYEEPDVSVRWSEGVKMREKGPSITVNVAHLAQNGRMKDPMGLYGWDGYSKEQIYGAYAFKAKRAEDMSQMKDTAFNKIFGAPIHVAEAIGTPVMKKVLNGPFNTGNGGDYAFDENAPVPIKKAEGLDTKTTLWPNFKEHAAKKILDWGNAVTGLWGKEPVKNTSKVYRPKWVPKYGNQMLQDDIWFYDDEIGPHITYDATDVIETIDHSHPLLQKPNEASRITTKNSIWSNMRTTPSAQFYIENENDSGDERSSETDQEANRVDIAQSNCMLTNDANGITSCLFENLHAYFPHDSTPSNLIKAPNGNLDFLQEVRGQVYVPAPLNMYPDQDWCAYPHPYIDMPIKLDMPPVFQQHATYGGLHNRITCRRAAWFVFNRYPIGKAIDMCTWMTKPSTKSGAYGLVILDGRNAHSVVNGAWDEYFIVADIHDLVNMSDILDPSTSPEISTISITSSVLQEPILDIGNGINNLTGLHGGANYATDGIFRNVPLVSVSPATRDAGAHAFGSGYGATADITVASGSVTHAVINKPGHGYETGSYLTANLNGENNSVSLDYHIEHSDGNDPNTHGEIVPLPHGNDIDDVTHLMIFDENQAGTDKTSDLTTYLKNGNLITIYRDNNDYVVYRCTADATDHTTYKKVAVEVLHWTDQTWAALAADEATVTLILSEACSMNPSSVTIGKDIKGFIPKTLVKEDWANIRFNMTIDGIKMSCFTEDDDNLKQSIIYPAIRVSGNTVKMPAIPDPDLTTGHGAWNPKGQAYISITGGFKEHFTSDYTTYDGTTNPNGASSFYDDHREWTPFRKYHMKSAYAGTQAAASAHIGGHLNVWSKHNSAKGMANGTAVISSDPTASDAISIYNGIRTPATGETAGSAAALAAWADGRGVAASLTYMWSPYLTVSLTSTRFGADNIGSLEINYANMDVTNGYIDTISRLYIDSIGAYRFNYHHQNASMNSGNMISSHLQIPPEENFEFLLLDQDGQDIPHNNYKQHLQAIKQNTGYISLGFKTKTDAHASAKFFLLNGFKTDTYQAAMPTGSTSLGYSSEMHPLGEFHPNMMGSYESTPTSIIKASASPAPKSSTWMTWWKGVDSGNDYEVGYPYMKSEALFGIPRDTNLVVTGDSDWPGGFQNAEALVSGADYYADGAANLVDNFTQSGLLKLDWNDGVASTLNSGELMNSLFVMAAPATDNIYNSGFQDYYKMSFETVEGSNNYAAEGFNSWGLRSKNRDIRAEKRQHEWVGPNLNATLIWDSDSSPGTTNRSSKATIHAADCDNTWYLSKSSPAVPLDSDTFRYSAGAFVRRENPLVQARIMNATPSSDAEDEANFEIRVDNGGVITNSDDELYIVYHAGREWVTENHTGFTDSASESHVNDIIRQNKYVCTIVTCSKNGDGTYTIKPAESAAKTNPVNVSCSDTGAGDLNDLIYNTNLTPDGNYNGFSNADIPQGRFINSDLCISPWRYWIYIKAETESFDRTYKSICQVTSALDADFNEAAGHANCALKTSYNSPVRTDSHVIDKPWNWELAPDSEIDLQADYGYGAFNYEDMSGGYLDKVQAKAGVYSDINISGLISTGRMSEQSISTIILMPDHNQTYLNSQISLDSDEGTNKPIIYSVFTDERPISPTDFSVKPQEGKEFYPEFTWGVEDDDIWYGFLIVDDKPINNQYHGCVLHIPFDNSEHNNTSTQYFRPDQGDIYGSMDAAGNLTQTGFVDTVSGVTANVEGLHGFTAHFDGTNDYIALNDGRYTQPTDEMSICLHITPDDTPAGNEYILHKNYEYAIYIDTNNQINVEVYPESADEANQVALELKSTSSIAADGSTPTNIIITLDTSLKSGNIKLYIDGRLEDQSGLRKITGTKNNWPSGVSLENFGTTMNVGCKFDGTTRSLYYDGKVEELTIYNKIINPISPKDESFVFKKPVKELTDATEAVSRSYSCKLFIKDYHNIRGASPRDVTATPQVSFRKAAFRLRTVD